MRTRVAAIPLVAAVLGLGAIAMVGTRQGKAAGLDRPTSAAPAGSGVADVVTTASPWLQRNPRAPAIFPDQARPHEERGPCDQCHQVLTAPGTGAVAAGLAIPAAAPVRELTAES